MRVGGIKISARIGRCYGGTATAPCLQLTLAALGKFIIFPISFQFVYPQISQPVCKGIAHTTVLHPAAGIDLACGQYRQMPVSAVTAAVNHLRLCILRDGKISFLVIIERPEVHISIVIGLAAGFLIGTELPVTLGQKLPIAPGGDSCIFIFVSRAVSGKGIDLRSRRHRRIDNLRYFVYIFPGNGGLEDGAV